jgi:conjugative transfer signal peptidase TraF
MTDLGLVAWSSRRRHRRCGRWGLLASGVGGLGALALAARPPARPQLIYNASASAPIGYYWVRPASRLQRGELVLVRPPPRVAAFAAERGYLPASVLLVKRIAALGGDRVCSDGSRLAINARPVVRLLRADRLGRPLPAWIGCRPLRPYEALLLMDDVAASFDSRYFGPVSVRAVVGRLDRAGR